MGVFKNGVGRPSNETIKKRNIFKVLCIVLALMVIGLLVYVINDLNTDKKDNNKNVEKTKNQITTTTRKITDGWYEPNGTAKELQLYGLVYKSFEDYIVVTDTAYVGHISDGDKINKLNIYKCNTSNCFLHGSLSYDKETILIYDGEYIIYNFEKNEAKKVSLGEYKDKLNYLNEDNYKCTGDYGSICSNTILAGKKVYYEFNSIGDFSPTIGIIDKEGKVVFFATDDDIKDKYLYDAAINYGSISYYDNGDILYAHNNSVYKYDANSKKTKKIDQYKEVVTIDKKYITAVDNNNNLNVYDEDGNKLANLAKITNQMKIHSALSGWFKEDRVDGKAKDEGIYVIVEDSSVKWEDLSEEMRDGQDKNNGYDLAYEYYYIPTTKEKGKLATYIGGYAKPVLYLYPTKDNTKVSVSFEKPELLTTTYPKYKNKWEVTANKNGDLYDNNGKYYYGLYWEESGSTRVDFNTGFYVTKENAISFLEDKLNKIGLNDKERNEFIMYWLPILEKNEKSLVYFELTNSREKYNKLIISPKPDSLLRIAIHVKKVNKKINIKEQILPTFERKGFTAVEWGGVIH